MELTFFFYKPCYLPKPYVCRQYFEDGDVVSPLICAWDFVIQRENKKVAGNETAAMMLNVTIVYYSLFQ